MFKRYAASAHDTNYRYVLARVICSRQIELRLVAIILLNDLLESGYLNFREQTDSEAFFNRKKASVCQSAITKKWRLLACVLAKEAKLKTCEHSLGVQSIVDDCG